MFMCIIIMIPFSTDQLDPSLSSLLQTFLHTKRYQQWMVQYTRCDEDIELIGLLEKQAQLVGVDLYAYAAVGTTTGMASAR